MAFELVSEETWLSFFNNPPSGAYYPDSPPSISNIEKYMPRRSTVDSAGYDFFMPYSIAVTRRRVTYVPTGFKWNPSDSRISVLREEWHNQQYPDRTHSERNMGLKVSNQVFLALYPRSSYGMKYGFRLLNTTGIIDADYYNNEDNEGHIIVAFTTSSDIQIKAGDKFCQGIIQPYFISTGEIEVNTVRSGGMGSTDVNNG